MVIYGMVNYIYNQPSENTDIQHFISIEFTDDLYSHNECKNQVFSVTFQLEEKFEQINFNNFKVYSVFEIISQGYSPYGKRKYNELSEELLRKLNSYDE